MKLYVEGGGDANALKTSCREAFTTFITDAGIVKRPRVVACGSRNEAYGDFCTAVANGEEAMLLVDSEGPVAAHCQQPANEPQHWKPWTHLKQRQGDNWDKPSGSQDMDCHLMVQCMETWFLADRATLATFFGQGFRENDLPAAANAIEAVAKTQVYDALKHATRDCKTKDAYGKGEHSFKLLKEISPEKVMEASPWAKRFIDAIKKKMGT